MRSIVGGIMLNDDGRMIDDGDTSRTLKSKRHYEYDNKGHKISCTDTLPNGGISFKMSTRYDKAGNKIEQLQTIYDEKGESETKFTYSYDGKSDLTEMGVVQGNGSAKALYIYSYEGYDTHDNWLKQTGYTRGAAIILTERVVEYW